MKVQEVVLRKSFVKMNNNNNKLNMSHEQPQSDKNVQIM